MSAISEEKIVLRLRESPIGSDGFTEAVDEYCRLMAENNGNSKEHVPFAEQVHDVLVKRFVVIDDFSALATAYGPHVVLNLFWFAIEGLVAGDAMPLFVPPPVTGYLAAHFRVCPECYEPARKRVQDAGGSLAVFDRLFPKGGFSFS